MKTLICRGWAIRGEQAGKAVWLCGVWGWEKRPSQIIRRKAQAQRLAGSLIPMWPDGNPITRIRIVPVEIYQVTRGRKRP